MYKESTLLNNAQVVGNYFECNPNDICLCIFPTHYMYGFSMLMAVLIKNGTVILERSTISPAEIVNYLNSHNITLLPILRDIVDKIYPFIEHSQYYFPSLKVINAADKIYTSQVRKILNFAPIFWNNFGQTESGPRLYAVKITSEPELEHYSHQEVVAIGFPVHKEILTKVVDENQKSAEFGKIGELYYQTPFGMDGYLLSNGQLEPAPLLKSSGDLVIQKKNGLVLWAGRKSQTIKINGSFVNINLLHNALDTFSDIEQSFFLYDEDKSEIHAFLEVNPEIEKNKLQQKIVHEFRKKFPRYPRLSKIHFLQFIPKTITGKIDLKALREYANSKT